MDGIKFLDVPESDPKDCRALGAVPGFRTERCCGDAEAASPMSWYRTSWQPRNPSCSARNNPGAMMKTSGSGSGSLFPPQATMEERSGCQHPIRPIRRKARRYTKSSAGLGFATSPRVRFSGRSFGTGWSSRLRDLALGPGETPQLLFCHRVLRFFGTGIAKSWLRLSSLHSLERRYTLSDQPLRAWLCGTETKTCSSVSFWPRSLSNWLMTIRSAPKSGVDRLGIFLARLC